MAVTAVSENADKARRRRNIALAVALGALVVLFYVMTMMRVHP
jgi:hypothetical protein